MKEDALLALDRCEHLVVFVRRVVVQDDVNLLFFGSGLLDLSQKPQHILVSVLAIAGIHAGVRPQDLDAPAGLAALACVVLVSFAAPAQAQNNAPQFDYQEKVSYEKFLEENPEPDTAIVMKRNTASDADETTRWSTASKAGMETSSRSIRQP